MNIFKKSLNNFIASRGTWFQTNRTICLFRDEGIQESDWWRDTASRKLVLSAWTNSRGAQRWSHLLPFLPPPPRSPSASHLLLGGWGVGERENRIQLVNSPVLVTLLSSMESLLLSLITHAFSSSPPPLSKPNQHNDHKPNVIITRCPPPTHKPVYYSPLRPHRPVWTNCTLAYIDAT